MALTMLRSNKHVGHVLVLTQQWQMEKNLNRLGIGRHDNQLRQITIQSLGGLIGTLPDLLVIGGLLNDVQDLGGQDLVSKRVRLWVNFSFFSLHKNKSLAYKAMQWQIGLTISSPRSTASPRSTGQSSNGTNCGHESEQFKMTRCEQVRRANEKSTFLQKEQKPFVP